MIEEVKEKNGSIINELRMQNIDLRQGCVTWLNDTPTAGTIYSIAEGAL